MATPRASKPIPLSAAVRPERPTSLVLAAIGVGGVFPLAMPSLSMMGAGRPGL
jgi:hypothetical protein